MRQYYEVSLRSAKQLSAFLSKLIASRIKITSLYYDQDGAHFRTDRQGVAVIRKHRRTYQMKVQIRRVGQRSIEQRLFSSSLFLISLIIPFVASFFLWDLTVESELPEIEERIERKLTDAAIRPYRPLASIPDEGTIRQYLMKDDPELSWIRFERSGATLKVVPMLSPKTDEPVHQKETYVDLIAKTGGVITQFQVTRGERVASVHQTVKKGDLLVSGKLSQGEKEVIVGADGFVFADYWKEYQFSIPRTISLNVLGEEKVQLSFQSPLKRTANGWTFQPIVKEERTQTKKIEQVTLKEGMEESFIIPLLKQKALAEASPQLRIKEENVLHIAFENDKVSGTILFLMNDNIAHKRPIAQGDEKIE